MKKSDSQTKMLSSIVLSSLIKNEENKKEYGNKAELGKEGKVNQKDKENLEVKNRLSYIKLIFQDVENIANT